MQHTPADEVEAVILREQARLIRDNSLAAQIAGTLCAGIVAIATYTHSDEMVIWVAFAGFLLLQLARFAFVLHASRANLVDRRPEVFIFWASIGSLAGGLCWSVVPMLAAHYGGDRAAVVAAISVTGVASGAVLLSSARAVYALLYAIPAMCGAFLWLALDGTTDGMLMACSTIFFVSVILVAAFRSQTVQIRSFRLAFERSRLVYSLEAANERAQAAIQQFEFLAMHDPLTGLLNRSAMTARFQDRLRDAACLGQRVGLMVLDLDHFKQVNDLFGHPVGDDLLIEVSARISAVVGPNDLVGRMGGDEFVIVFDHERRDAAATGQALIDMMAAPFPLGGRPTIIGLSIGVALYPDHADTVDALMSRADMALYAAKQAGRMRWAMFHEGLCDRAREEQEIEAELRTALCDGQIHYHYQPQINLADRRVSGLEALIRWRHPTRGYIAPDEIIAAAHRSNQSEALINCALRDACQMLRRLEGLGIGEVRVAVNISPRDFELCDVAQLVEAQLAQHGVPAGRLEIEITEDAILESDRAEPQLQRLASLGVALAIDDFGVGYSSIARLKDLSIDRLKIDRRFAKGIDQSESSRMLFQAITAVGRSLKIEIIAEGIETIGQLEAIADLNCDVAQGHLFTPALPPDAAIDWLLAFLPHQVLATRLRAGS